MPMVTYNLKDKIVMDPMPHRHGNNRWGPNKAWAVFIQLNDFRRLNDNKALSPLFLYQYCIYMKFSLLIYLKILQKAFEEIIKRKLNRGGTICTSFSVANRKGFRNIKADKTEFIFQHCKRKRHLLNIVRNSI